ncbi:MAG: diguanylate cyclase [Candidatus Sumerlaeia bacterium]
MSDVFRQETSRANSNSDFEPRERDPRHYPMLMGVEGCMKGRRFILDRQVVALGRDMLADVILKDNKVSRHHARIIYLNISEKNERPICRIFDAGSTNGTYVNKRKVGSGGMPLSDNDRIQIGKTIFTFFVQDDNSVSENERMEVLANQDEVTGLLNENVFNRVLPREFERARRYERNLSVIILRIDKLDEIRHKYGVAASHAILRRLGFLLSHSLRSHDIVARMSGEDEMAILLPETNEEGTEMVAERLMQAIHTESIPYGNHELCVQGCMGVASLPWDMSSADELIQNARKAAQEANMRGATPVLVYGRT